MHPLFENPVTIFLIGLGLLVLFFLHFVGDRDRWKRNIGTLLTAGICSLCLLSVIPP